MSVTTLPNEDNAVYSLLRVWVYDDPTRQAPPPGRHERREGITLPNPRQESAASQLRLVPKRQYTSVEDIFGSACSSSEDGRCGDGAASRGSARRPEATALLEEHLGRLRTVRKWWQRRGAHRRKRFRPRLEALGVPISGASAATEGVLGGGGVREDEQK